MLYMSASEIFFTALGLALALMPAAIVAYAVIYQLVAAAIRLPHRAPPLGLQPAP